MSSCNPFKDTKVSVPVIEETSFVGTIRKEVAIAKQLLDLKAEIGRLPLTARTKILLDKIENWFNNVA